MTRYRTSFALEIMLVSAAGMCLAVSASALAAVLVMKGPAAAIALLGSKPKK